MTQATVQTCYGDDAMCPTPALQQCAWPGCAHRMCAAHAIPQQMPDRDEAVVCGQHAYNTAHSNVYHAPSFGESVRRLAKKAGREAIEKALVLYHCLNDRDTPPPAKSVIIGALGYLIAPLDAIPDLIPVLGFTDDLGVLAVALTIVVLHIKPAHREQAQRQVRAWFGEG